MKTEAQDDENDDQMTCKTMKPLVYYFGLRTGSSVPVKLKEGSHTKWRVCSRFRLIFWIVLQLVVE